MQHIYFHIQYCNARHALKNTQSSDYHCNAYYIKIKTTRQCVYMPFSDNRYSKILLVLSDSSSLNPQVALAAVPV